MLIHHCTLTSESNAGECSIVTQVVKCAPRVCGDDPARRAQQHVIDRVLPAYAGMILATVPIGGSVRWCSPRMRG